MNPLLLRILCITLLTGISATPAIADPLSEMAGFSVFQNVDAAKITKPMALRGPELSNPRDLTVQCCYIIQAPIERVIQADGQWNVMRHPEMKVYIHSSLPAHPSPADFERLANAPGNSAVASFVAATEKLNPAQPQLQMSKEEAKLFSPGSGGATKGRMPDNVAKFWSNLLSQRSVKYLSGGLSALPPYQSGSESIRPSEEASRMLKEQPKIYDQFRGLIGDTPAGGGRGQPAPYWELFDVEGQGAVCLGANYKKMVGPARQSLNIQYYACSGYYVMITLQQMWPMTFNGKPATLVWRGDMLSSSKLGDLHGMERTGSGMVMSKTVQRAAAAFQKDVVANP